MFRTRTAAAAARALFAPDGTLLALVADGETLADRIAGLAEITDRAVLDQLAADIAAEGERLYGDGSNLSPEVVADLSALAAGAEAVRTRITEVETAEAELATAAAAAIATLRPQADGDNADGADNADGDNADAANADAGADAVAASAGRSPALPRRTPAPAPLPAMGADAGGNANPAARPQGGAQTTTVALAAESTIVAQGNFEGIDRGEVFTTRDQLVTAFDMRRTAASPRRGAAAAQDENVLVASIRTTVPEDRVLGDDPRVNSRRIVAATDRTNDALVAAGGLCAPIENLYDVDILGSVARPVRDALVGFQADRGGISYRVPPTFQQAAGAVSQWTLEDDAAVGDPDTPDGETPSKPCIEVFCTPTQQAFLYAVPLCMTFHNITARTDPEMTAANVQAGMIAHARFAENLLLAGIANASKTLTSGTLLGATRDLLVAFDHVIAYYRNRHRLEDAVTLRNILPRWVRDLIRADLTRGMAGDLDALAVADAQIDSWFARRGVNVTWHLDGRAATVAGAGEVAMAQQFYSDAADLSAVPGFPDQVENLLFPDGDMLFLDGGQMDLGVVRSADLVSTNSYRQFVETFEGLAPRGLEPLRVVSTVQPRGAVAGTVDTAAIND